jgi:hypothetical protein
MIMGFSFFRSNMLPFTLPRAVLLILLRAAHEVLKLRPESFD